MSDFELYQGESIREEENGTVVFRSHYLNFAYDKGELTVENPGFLAHEYRNIKFRFKDTEIPESIKDENGRVKINFSFDNEGITETGVKALLEHEMNYKTPVLIKQTQTHYTGKMVVPVVEGEIITDGGLVDFRVFVNNKNLLVTIWFDDHNYYDSLSCIQQMLEALSDIRRGLC